MKPNIEMMKQKFGIHVNEFEFGFCVDHIFKVVTMYEVMKIPILGGDVYVKDKSGIYIPSYDNWYTNKIQGESYELYLTRTIQNTNKYIRNYKNRDDIIFVLVPN